MKKLSKNSYDLQGGKSTPGKLPPTKNSPGKEPPRKKAPFPDVCPRGIKPIFKKFKLHLRLNTIGYIISYYNLGDRLPSYALCSSLSDVLDWALNLRLTPVSTTSHC